MALTNNSHTKITAENTFTNGLVMDFAPENTSNNVLTNALNATFITFNGNEQSLQNDMGNARVNTAYLPTGYVPVGTCEFGDIIYIVSYNPIENKSQIGCFPSPERNISNKEISKLVQSVNKSEFVEYTTKTTGSVTVDDQSTGIIKASTAKKIVYGNSNVNPGDKFLISWGAEGIQNKNYISNFGNTSKNIDNVETYWPKLMQVHVVSIEDSGKITKLDSTVKWYTNGSGSEASTFIVSDEDLNNDSNVATVDSYRNALQCQYSVFQSKTAGKLALYFELETINNFSCGHKIFQRTNNNQDTVYDIYLSASWETDNYNINPCGMIITDSEFYHMESVDTTDTRLNLSSLKANTVSETQQKRNIYSASRVIEFTRTYRMEDYISSYNKSYSDFINKDSYYTQIENYKNIKIPYGKDVPTTDLDPDKVDTSTSEYTILASRAVRIYSYDSNGSKFPKTQGSMSSQEDLGVYVINPDRSTKVTSEDLKNQIEEAYAKSGVTVTVGEYFYQTRIDAYWGACREITIPDDVVVNYFKRSVLKKLSTVKKTAYIPETPSDTDSLQIAEGVTIKDQQEYKIKYTVCPCMPYGVLDSLAITNTINFNANQDGSVELATWQYYVNTTSLVLKFGFTPHLKEAEDEVIDKVVMQFYDTQGVCASYELTGQDSYDATFTEYFELDRVPSNSRFSSKSLTAGTREVSTQIYRQGTGTYTYADITESNKYSYFITYNGTNRLCATLDETATNKIPKSTTVYQQTAGVLYYGRPYGVRIYIFKGVLTELGEIDTSGYDDPIVYDRWLWTAPVFNDSYNSTPDFKNCELRTGLDFQATLDSRKMAEKSGSFVVSPTEYITNDADSTFRAKVDYVSNGEIVCKGVPVLVDNFGKSLYLNNSALKSIQVYITTNDANNIAFDSEKFTTEYEESYIQELTDLYPKYNNEIDFIQAWNNYPSEIQSIISTNIPTDVVISDINKDNLLDSFELTLKNVNKQSEAKQFTYLDSSGETQIKSTDSYLSLESNKWVDTGVTLNLQGVKFTKIQANETASQESTDIYVRALETSDDLETYGLGIATQNAVFYHPELPWLGINEKGGKNGYIGMGTIAFNSDCAMSNVTTCDWWEDNDEAGIDFGNSSSVSKYKALLGVLMVPALIFRPDQTDSGKDGMRIAGANLQKLTQYGVETGLDSNCFSSGSYIRINSSGLTGFQGKKNVGVFLIYQDSESNEMSVGSDFRLYYTNSSSKLYQLFNKPAQINDANNYADLIGSLLYNIFVKIDGSRTYYTPSNIANIKKYTESWNKDIIVMQVLDSKFEDHTDSFNLENSSSTLITILPGFTSIVNEVETIGINLFAYVRQILAKMYNVSIESVGNYSNYTPEISNALADQDKPEAGEYLTFKNINPIIQKSTKSISFQYSIPYTPNAVKSALNTDSTKTGFVRIFDGNNPKYIQVVPPTDETKVYGYDSESKALHVIRSSSNLVKMVQSIKKCKDGYLYGTLSSTTVPLTSSGLFNCLRSSAGSLRLQDLTQLKNYYSKYQIEFKGSASNDSNYIQGLVKTYIFKGLNAW